MDRSGIWTFISLQPSTDLYGVVATLILAFSYLARNFQPEMLSLNIPSYSKPSGYQVSELAKPELSDPKDVIIKVHAASINPIDVKKADGMLKLALKDSYVIPYIAKIVPDMNSFPYKIGYDCAGIVTEVGSDVTRFEVGDEVYTRLPEVSRGMCSPGNQIGPPTDIRSLGSCSEFVRCAEKYIALKPPSLSFEDAASIPLAAMTALQALRKYKGDLLSLIHI